MITLLELHETLLDLTGPSRDADVLVGTLLVPEPREFNLTHKVLRNRKPPCPNFTTSVDEVMKLVPEGMALSVVRFANGKGKAILWKDSFAEAHQPTKGCDSATPAIAALLTIVQYHLNQ